MLRRLLVAGILLVVAVAGVLLSASRPDREEVDAFTSGLVPIVQDWGSVEILGMRPAFSDLQAGEGVPPEAMGTEAQAWLTSFDRYRDELDALGTPQGLEAVVADLHASLDRYSDAATAFAQAATAATEGRAVDLEPGFAAAADGAHLYDQAIDELQRVRQSLGLEPSPEL